LEQLVASSSDSSNRDRGSSRFAHLQLPTSAAASPTHQPFLDSSGLLTASPRTNNQECNNNNIMAGLGGYDETNSMLALVQAGQDLQALQTTSQAALQTIDLMQMPSVPGRYNGYSSLRPFESSIFSSQ
jgi:hypothetical protein